jgi:hypothetical protein
MATELPRERLQRPSHKWLPRALQDGESFQLTHNLTCYNFYYCNNFFLHYNLHNLAIRFCYFSLTRRLRT